MPLVVCLCMPCFYFLFGRHWIFAFLSRFRDSCRIPAPLRYFRPRIVCSNFVPGPGLCVFRCSVCADVLELGERCRRRFTTSFSGSIPPVVAWSHTSNGTVTAARTVAVRTASLLRRVSRFLCLQRWPEVTSGKRKTLFTYLS